ncbi:MAG: hypothetical protein WD534_14500 [Phycisphaeraceae bacterium]
MQRDTVRITSGGDARRYRLPWIHRRGFQRNGMAALLIGAIPCAVVGLGVPTGLQWLLGERLYDAPAWFIQPFLWFWRSAGIFFGLLFTSVTILTMIKGGTAWLSLRPSVLWVGAFFGGEFQLQAIDCASIRAVIVERSESESDVIERGHIRFVKDGANDVLAAEGYPLDLLEPIGVDLRQRLGLEES